MIVRTTQVMFASRPILSSIHTAVSRLLMVLPPVEMKKLTLRCTKKMVRNEQIQEWCSEIDPTQIISDDFWAISLVRLPDRIHALHVFFVLEGKIGIHSRMWFADFVASDGRKLFFPGTRNGKVRIHEENTLAGSSQKLLFQCKRKMMTIKEGDPILSLTWTIPKLTAEQLLKNIYKQKKEPPNYNVLGNSPLAKKLANLNNNCSGHNCFSFATTMLHDLNVEYIRVPDDKQGNCVYSSASQFLVHEKK